MVQVNVDNKIISTSISNQQFFATPKIVQPTKYTKTPPSAPTEAVYDQKNNYFYLGLTNGGLSKVEVETGTFLWTQSVDSVKITDVDVEDGEIYATTTNKLVKLDDTGNQNWSVSGDFHSVKRLPNGNLQVGNSNGDIELLDGADGSVLQTAASIVKDDRLTCLGRAEDTSDLFVAGIQNASEPSFTIKRIDGSDSTSFGDIMFESFSISTFYDKETVRYNGAATDGKHVVTSGYLKNNSSNNRGARTFAVGPDGSQLYQDGSELFYVGIAPDGTFSAHNGDVITQYESVFRNKQIRQLDSGIPISTEAFVASINADKILHIVPPTDYTYVDFSKPTTQQATYKLTVSGGGPIKIGVATVIPEGQTGSVEAFVNDGTEITGNCYISGVLVK